MKTLMHDAPMADELMRRIGSIGHELCNPLGVIETSTFLLRSAPELSANGRKHLDRIEAQVRLANEIICRVLEMGRDRPLGR